MRKIVYVLTAVLMLTVSVQATAGVVNPVTDICWECLFPITVSGVNVTPGHRDQASYNQAFCTCRGCPPKVGIPISFWEPARMVEVTRHAYKLISLGGISIGQETIKNRGSIGVIGEGATQNSFYHVHWYVWPILSWLGLFLDFDCVEHKALEVAYMSEFDPLWNDDTMAFILDPEAAFFSSQASQLACMSDCVSCSAGRPVDSLFWCAGCEGSLYPFSGTVAHHTGGAQASALLTHRLIAKFHRAHLMKGYDANEFCQSKYMPKIKKSLYKVQMVHPVANTAGPCYPLGATDLLWGAGKTYPGDGEDFVYLLWIKRQCCLDAVKTGATAAGI